VVLAFVAGGGVMGCGAGGMASGQVRHMASSRPAVQGGEDGHLAVSSVPRQRRVGSRILGFERERFKAANVAGAFGPRRGHLAALDAELCRWPGLLCGLVERDGLRVLRVVREGAASRAVEVSCREETGGWVFTWADSDEALGPVTDPEAVADRVTAALTERVVR